LAGWAAKKAKAEAKKLLPPDPELINPTDADAERLQALWNAKASAGLTGYNLENFKPSQVVRITQAQYSAHSKGTYANAGTKGLCAEGVPFRAYSGLYAEKRTAALAKQGPVLCKVRRANRLKFYSPERVVILTDKPQKPLPASVWLPYVAPVAVETANT